MIKLRTTIPSEQLADIVQNHIFFYLVDTQRSVGYNEYKLSNGSLVTVDLDRLNFNNVISKKVNTMTLCHLCKITESTVTKLQEAGEDDSLTIAIQNSLQYDPFQIVFTNAQGNFIQDRISKFLRRCLDPCISMYGIDDVIIPN